MLSSRRRASTWAPLGAWRQGVRRGHGRRDLHEMIEARPQRTRRQFAFVWRGRRKGTPRLERLAVGA
eukprot:5179110-Prymnesium_polylepis.1